RQGPVRSPPGEPPRDRKGAPRGVDPASVAGLPPSVAAPWRARRRRSYSWILSATDLHRLPDEPDRPDAQATPPARRDGGRNGDRRDARGHRGARLLRIPREFAASRGLRQPAQWPAPGADRGDQAPIPG